MGAMPVRSGLENSFTFTAPGVTQQTSYTGKVTITNKRGVSIEKPLAIMIDLAQPQLSGHIDGPALIGAGTPGDFSVSIDPPVPSGIRYDWSLPQGWTSNSLSAQTIRITPPRVSAPTSGNIAVIAQQSASNSITLSKDVTVVPQPENGQEEQVVQPPPSPAPTQPCAAPWSASTAYSSSGQRVSQAGQNYSSNWWTQGDDPATKSGPDGSGQPWKPLGSCSQ